MAAPQQIANYVQSTLASSCTSGAATLSVVSVSGWPIIGNFRLRIDDVAPATTYEIVEATSVNVGANQVTVTRGMEGTTGIAHNAGALIGNVLTAAMLASFPFGILQNGYAKVIATQGTFTALTAITGLSITVTVGTSRQVKVSALVGASSSVASDSVLIEILEGATVLDLVGVTLPIANQVAHGTPFAILSPTAGSHTYTISMQRGSGTGNITMQAAATFPSFIMAEDIGPV